MIQSQSSVASAAGAPSTSREPIARIQSIDIVRGLVMVLMAIDHVRVYSGVPAGGQTPGIFFTRWITHFCAPTFVFLAGTSSFLYGRKLGNVGALSRHLLVRGLILVVLEMTLIRFTWTFNLDYSRFVLAGVIWMLGWCMVLLAGLVRLPVKAVGWIGLAIVVFQQVFEAIPHLLPTAVQEEIGWLWEFVYPSRYQPPQPIAILYVLVPWIGVMAAGYGFGLIVARDAESRRRWCLRIGLGAIVLFLAIAGTQMLLIPLHRNTPVWVRLLNQQKYPASQLFLLMTLGPAIAGLALVDRAPGWIARVLATFGRVPMFYYLMHIPAIHIAALVAGYIREGAIHSEWYASAPFTSVPAAHRWDLPLLYLVFAVVVTALYFPCRWFDGLKARRRAGWLKYI